MPQNIRDSETTGNGDGINDATATAAAAFERLRSMLMIPPANRTADWVNPLEKIEQLLTCAVCLDRYKNPKLLPCQHTFCMEPCLDGLIDLVRRMVRCPECRAEHPLPYDGLKAFQTNYTLMGFLEIHVQATEENAGDLEAYIRRYNLERCKICDEKAEVDYCPHCEKRICLECKATHADMLKRDLGRLMNQVKRACTRITDSSDTLARGIDSLNVNCENVKEEIRDYTRRYMKELKKREETLINEVEAFFSGETRMIGTVRDNLELEAKNMNDACGRVDACLKGEKELADDELVRYKQMFTDGLDYLRMSNPDADELINKKIRFVITDAHVLPHAILQFGELQICTPQFNHKFIHAEKMYVPRFLQLGMESDNYPGKKRLGDVEATTTPSWKQKATNTTVDEDAYSSRYRRRQQLEEQAWNRIRVEQEQQQGGGQSPSAAAMRRSPRSGALDDALSGTSPNSRGTGALDVASPWIRPSHRAASDLAPESITVLAVGTESSSPTPIGILSPVQQQARVVVVKPRATMATENAAGPSGSQTRTRPENESGGNRELDQRVANIRKEHERRQQEQEENFFRVTKKRARNRTAPVENGKVSTGGDSSDEDEDENEEESDPHERIAVQVFPKPKPPNPGSRQLRVDTDGSASRDPASSEPAANGDWRKYLIPTPPETGQAGRHSSTAVTDLTSGLEPPTRSADPASHSSSSRESETGDSSPERQRRFIRSRTDPDFEAPLQKSERTHFNSESGHRYRTESTGSYDGRESVSPVRRGSMSRSEREAEQRKNRYRRKAERSHNGYAGSSDDGLDPYVGLDRPVAEAAQRFEISVQGNGVESPAAGTGGARFYRVFAQPKIDYESKGRCLSKFGSKGNGEGQFNWPRGIAIIPGSDEIAVCDSSNHRMQIFDKRGRFLKTIGSYGSGRSEFDCSADVCLNKHGQFVVTDRYNHRVQIFDANGRHSREFGAHGQTNGRFNSPWGVVVDQQGFVYVCDKDNHRVQIFQSDGNFVGKFGTAGNREGQFQNPHFVACNRHNQLIVSDSGNHRIQVFDHNGHFLFTFGSEGFHEGQFKCPRGVAVDEQGFIVVADSGNNRIQVFYPDGRFLTTFGGWGTGDGQLKGVEGVAVGPDGRVFATDRENHRVQIF